MASASGSPILNLVNAVDQQTQLPREYEQFDGVEPGAEGTQQPGQAAAKAAEAAGTPQAADAAEARENARAVVADAQETADDVAGELAGNEGAE